MKNVLLFVFIAVLVPLDSCKKDNCYCGVEDPQENLPWLKSNLELLNPFPDDPVCLEVYSLLFEEGEYIGIANCRNTPDGITTLYDCQGNRTFEYGGMTGGAQNFGMPETFSIEYFLNHRKLIYTIPTN